MTCITIRVCFPALIRNQRPIRTTSRPQNDQPTKDDARIRRLESVFGDILLIDSGPEYENGETVFDYFDEHNIGHLNHLVATHYSLLEHER